MAAACCDRPLFAVDASRRRTTRQRKRHEKKVGKEGDGSSNEFGPMRARYLFKCDMRLCRPISGRHLEGIASDWNQHCIGCRWFFRRRLMINFINFNWKKNICWLWDAGSVPVMPDDVIIHWVGAITKMMSRTNRIPLDRMVFQFVCQISGPGYYCCVWDIFSSRLGKSMSLTEIIIRSF